jgi:hypothetical protein
MTSACACPTTTWLSIITRTRLRDRLIRMEKFDDMVKVVYSGKK